MSLVPMLDLLRPAREKGYALPAFECWNSASIYGAVAAAAEGGFPLILQASPVEYGTMGGADVLRRIAELYANRFGVTRWSMRGNASRRASRPSCWTPPRRRSKRTPH